MRRIPLYPLLFAVYPVLFLYAQNQEEALFIDTLRPAAITILLGALVFGAAWLVSRNRSKAAAVSAVWLIIIFSYGHVIGLLRGVCLAGYVVGRGLVVMPLWLLVGAVVSLSILRARGDLKNLSQTLSLAGFALVAMTIVQIGYYEVRPHKSANAAWAGYVRGWTDGRKAAQPANGLRDVYYFILDEYARADVLHQRFGFDNTQFTDYLRRKGFFVADQSCSNYLFTYVSLASSLNMDYLTELAHSAGQPGVTTNLLGEMIEDNRTALLFKKLGYKFLVFPSEFYVTNRNANADRIYRRQAEGLTEFDRVLLTTTVFRPLWGGANNHRLNRYYKFDTVPEVADIKEPTFTFVHLIMPHPPYVFCADGSLPKRRLLDRDQYTRPEAVKLYTGQVAYLNKRMEKVIDAILERSERPPIIIIQGDHGFIQNLQGYQPDVFEKSGILNAYYLPDGGGKELYPSISPVNSFRLVFSHYFGQHMKLLPDKTYVADKRTGQMHFHAATVHPPISSETASGPSAP